MSGFLWDITFADLPEAGAAFEVLCRRAGKIKWVVYAKAPFSGPSQILMYLAGYTHRVAISHRRILAIIHSHRTGKAEKHSIFNGCSSFRFAIAWV
jgi:hypothetical protein